MRIDRVELTPYAWAASREYAVVATARALETAIFAANSRLFRIGSMKQAAIYGGTRAVLFTAGLQGSMIAGGYFGIKYTETNRPVNICI